MLLGTDPITGDAFISGASTLPGERGKGFNKFTILAAINEGERATGRPVLLGHPRATGEVLTPIQRKNFKTLEDEGCMITRGLDPRISEFANQGLALIEERLAANGIEVELQSKFLQWLAEPTDVPDDASEFERAVAEIKGRTKNLVEGAIIGTLFDTLIVGGRAVRRANLVKQAERNLVRATRAVGERGAVRRGPTGRLPVTEGPFPTATLGPQREGQADP